MATRTSQTRRATKAASAAKPIRISPKRALAKVRKPVAPPARIEDAPTRYRRAAERRRALAIIVDEVQGC